jgi:hypothetical protein
MQATVYLFDDLAWRKRARWSRPVDPHDLDQFVCQLETLLKRLGDLHLRLARAPARGRARPRGRGSTAVVDNLGDPLTGLGPWQRGGCLPSARAPAIAPSPTTK